MVEPLLSVCIPTFNRRALLEPLVMALLAHDDVEVCVHDDGSTDGTDEVLSQLKQNASRLRVSRGPNGGRAVALARASALATGRFVMMYDDDDLISDVGLAAILRHCRTDLPSAVCGYVFKMNRASGEPIGAPFPASRSNFLELRADHGLIGDHKEVVLRALWLGALQSATIPARRIPTSLYWSVLALDYDVICIDLCIGVKNYYDDGISKNIKVIKDENISPIIKLHEIKLRGYIRGRYKSVLHVVRSIVAICFYRAKNYFRNLK